MKVSGEENPLRCEAGRPPESGELQDAPDPGELENGGQMNSVKE